jgi:histidine triad (HIT) family protein
MSECVFCDIAAGEAPAEIINSNGFSMTIVPLNPVTPGHVIVIPRKHVRDALSDPNVTGLVMHSAALMGQRLRKYHPDYASVNIITSVGAPATQTVFHLHIHVVPRREGDGLHLPWTEPSD